MGRNIRKLFNDFEKYFQEIILKSTSDWDTSKEAFYHGLSLGMLSYLDNDYYVTSNFQVLEDMI